MQLLIHDILVYFCDWRRYWHATAATYCEEENVVRGVPVSGLQLYVFLCGNVYILCSFRKAPAVSLTS